MRKILSVLACLLLLGCLAVPALAAPEGPQITLHPQSYHYPEYSVAVYTVKANGSNLHATWYLEYQGKTYNLSDNQNGFEPWEGYAGENYGPMEEGPNTFSWFFGGIEEELSGAQIWCVIEDGHYDVTSDRAMVTVQGDQMPPEILQIPAALSVKQGEQAELRCVAKSTGGAQLRFQWYETTSGKLQDIRAISGEESDFINCSTASSGTRYYVCCVSDTNGGMVYSSVVPVNVTDAPKGKAPTFLTKTLPQGTVGEDYGFTLETDDHGAVFSVANGASDFEKTGLKLSMEGMMMGKLTKAGTYTFTIRVSNDYGEDHGTLTLKVVDPSQATQPTTPETTPATTPATTPEGTVATTPDTTPESTPDTTTASAPEGTEPQGTEPGKLTDLFGEVNFLWLGYVLIVLGGVAAGVGVACIFIFQKKKP